MTTKIKEASKILDIYLLDRIIVTFNKLYQYNLFPSEILLNYSTQGVIQ